MLRLAASSVRSVRGPTARYFVSQSTQETTQPAVLLLDKIDFAHDELTRLKKEANVVASKAKTREEFAEEANSIKDLVAIYRHFGGSRSVKVGISPSHGILEKPSFLTLYLHD